MRSSGGLAPAAVMSGSWNPRGSRMSSSAARVSGAGLPFLSHEIVGLGPVGRLRDEGNDRRNETTYHGLVDDGTLTLGSRDFIL
jgi:hypothetical protein